MRRETAIAAQVCSTGSFTASSSRNRLVQAQGASPFRGLAERPPLPRRVQSVPSFLAGGITRGWPTTAVKGINSATEGVGPYPLGDNIFVQVLRSLSLWN